MARRSELSLETKRDLRAVEESLDEANRFFKRLEKEEYDEMTSKLTPLDRAKYDLSVLYGINSLFWMLKRSYGEDPQEHEIRMEIERIKEQMARLRQIAENMKRPRLNLEATRRIVVHQLQLSKKRKLMTEQEETWENNETQDDDGTNK